MVASLKNQFCFASKVVLIDVPWTGLAVETMESVFCSVVGKISIWKDSFVNSEYDYKISTILQAYLFPARADANPLKALFTFCWVAMKLI